MAKYRKKNPEVEVWKMDSMEPKPDWVFDAFDVGAFRMGNYGDRVYVKSLDGSGTETAWCGVDYIIRHDEYIFSVIPKNVFERDYEEVS